MRICIMLFFSIFHCHLPINSHLLMNYEIQYSLITWITPWNINPLEPSKFQKLTIHKMWPPQNLIILHVLINSLRVMSFDLFIQLYAHFSCFIRLVIIFYQNLWDMTGIFILHCIHQEQYFCTLIKSMFQFFHLFFFR